MLDDPLKTPVVAGVLEFAAAAGNLSRSYRVFHLGSVSGDEPPNYLSRSFRYTVRHTSSSSESRTSHQRLCFCLRGRSEDFKELAEKLENQAQGKRS